MAEESNKTNLFIVNRERYSGYVTNLIGTQNTVNYHFNSSFTNYIYIDRLSVNYGPNIVAYKLPVNVSTS